MSELSDVELSEMDQSWAARQLATSEETLAWLDRLEEFSIPLTDDDEERLFALARRALAAEGRIDDLEQTLRNQMQLKDHWRNQHNDALAKIAELEAQVVELQSAVHLLTRHGHFEMNTADVNSQIGILGSHALSSEAGRGWLSPEQAQYLQERIRTLEETMMFLRRDTEEWSRWYKIITKALEE